MKTRAGDVVEAYPLFRVGGGGSIPTPALSCRDLWFSTIDLGRAKTLCRQWHSRFPDVGGGGSRVCHAAEHGMNWYAAAVWTNPSSPKLPQLSWLMLKRFAIAAVRPAYTASRMMGWMIRDIASRLPDVEWLVSYSDPDSHEGTIYQATGWIRDELTRRDGPGWKNRERAFAGNRPCGWVQRWLYPMWLEFRIDGQAVLPDGRTVRVDKHVRVKATEQIGRRVRA